MHAQWHHRRSTNTPVRSTQGEHRRSRRVRHAAACVLGALGVVVALVVATASAFMASNAFAADSGTNLLTEPFTGSTVEGNWTFVGSAGLTAVDPGDKYYCPNREGLDGQRHGNGWNAYTDPDYIGFEHGDGFLLLTDINGSRTGTVLYNEPVQSRLGLDITFYQYQFGGNGADGIGFYLVDGQMELSQSTMGPTGSDVGGAFGYAAYKTSSGTDEGIENGLLCIGLDVYGTFSATDQAGGEGSHECVEHEDGENSGEHAHSVTVRGAGGQDRNGNWTVGYNRLATTQVDESFLKTGAPSQDRNGENESGIAGGVEVNIHITPVNENGKQLVTVTLTKASGETIEPIKDLEIDALPESVKFGFTASTGGNYDAHFIRGLEVKTVTPVGSNIMITKQLNTNTAEGGTSQTVFQSGDTVPYRFVVTNVGGQTLSNVTVKDPYIANITTSPDGDGATSVTLKPGETETFYGSLVLTDDQAKGGFFTNTAIATGTDEDGSEVTNNEDETITTVEPLPAPEHSKKIGKNNDGTYTLALDVVGDQTSSTTVVEQPLDIVMVLDTSGSMNYGIGEVYSADLDRSKTYIVNTGTGTSEEVQYNRYRKEWGYSSWGYWNECVPTTSASDQSWNHTQFYEQTRLTALQEAANQFIDSVAERNGDITDDAAKINLSIVEFAGSSSVYESLAEITEDNVNSYKQTINEINANGGTQADSGFEKALDQIKKQGRDDAKKVVIFFTDGVPTSGTDFEETVANGAVTYANTLKNTYNASIYSVGIFDGADASVISGDTETAKANTFMNAVSSNYPNATAWNSLGERVNDTAAYYKTADDSAGLMSVFDEIFTQETTTSGYTNVVIYDELSQYAKTDGIEYDETSGPDSDGFYKITNGATLVDDNGSVGGVQLLYKPADSDHGEIVKAVFPAGEALEDGLTYTLKFKVVPTDAAYEEYAQNGYGDTEGDLGTDLYQTVTSSEQPGFYSNDTAEVIYTAGGKEGQRAEYDKPVLQVESVKVENALEVTKTLDGHALDKDMFSFTVTAVDTTDGAKAEEAKELAGFDDTTVTYTNAEKADAGKPGVARWGNTIIVTPEDLGADGASKTYTYEYSEASHLAESYDGLDENRVNFDTNVYRVALTVSKNDDGKLQVSIQKYVQNGDDWNESGDELVLTAGDSTEISNPITIDFHNSMKPYGLAVTKVDQDNKPLPGAKFALYLENTDGTSVGSYDEDDALAEVYSSATSFDDDHNLTDAGFTVNDDGVVTFYGLEPGQTYWVVEKSVPSGYQMSEPYKLEVDDSGKASLYKPGTNGYELVSKDMEATVGDDALIFRIEFQNLTVEPLPSSGSSGTIAMGATGVAIVTVAAAWTLKKKGLFNH